MKRDTTTEDIIIEALIYIEWHIQEGIKPTDISKEMNCPYQSFKLMFKDITGLRLPVYLRLRALIEAKREWNINERIEQIAIKYNLHPESLIRSFKKEFGYSFFDKEITPTYPKLIGKKLIEAISNVA
ncbi:AraC family transcriptional regulator [uncultured Bacteroides sp.]|uniref:AraC family transcriptional regulator n=1 Tax=uncultured Bacteroides sp. TaxID=162156 RepID=UPI002AAB4031|nr:AraC family transcriptional regulator [uncultured Bacteroides sp.]